MKISTIIHEAHATAVDKGWHEKPVCTFPGLLHYATSTCTAHYVEPVGVDVDRVARLLLMIHTEIGEAWECFQNGEIALTYDGPKPEGLPSELADIVIRVGDLSGALGLPLVEACAKVCHYPGTFDVELTDLVSYRTSIEQEQFNAMRSDIDAATECLRQPDLAALTTELARLLAECQRVAVYFDIDLVSAVRIKMAFNQTRPHRHGGKAL